MSVSLAERLSQVATHWQPHIAAGYKGSDIMVELLGEVTWHAHPDTDTDNLFLVLQGEMDVELRDRTVTPKEGEMLVVPAVVEHLPVARQEAHALLIEPSGTPNTGDRATATAKPRI